MKTKFNPKDVPSWCKWIAVDKDGVCCAFKHKPKHNCYGHPVWSHGFKSYDTRFLYRGKPPKNWREELYTWGY